MPWNQVFPLGTDLVSNAPPLFQQNWAFINANINTDHYFNSGGATEGHHKFSQYFNQGIDPALIGDGEIYVKPSITSGTIQPFYRNAINIRQIPTFTGGTIAIAGGITTGIVDLTGVQGFSGFFICFDLGGSANMASAAVVWDNVNARVSQLSVRGAVTALGEVGQFITITTTPGGPRNFQWSYTNFYP